MMLVALGLLMGAPTLRLRADYLAIVTIAVGEILRGIEKKTMRRQSLQPPGAPPAARHVHAACGAHSVQPTSPPALST